MIFALLAGQQISIRWCSMPHVPPGCPGVPRGSCQVAGRLCKLREVGTAQWVLQPAPIHGLDLHGPRVEGTVALQPAGRLVQVDVQRHLNKKNVP